MEKNNILLDVLQVVVTAGLMAAGAWSIYLLTKINF